MDASAPLIILKCSFSGDIKNYLGQIKIDVGNTSHRLDDLVTQQSETKQKGAYCANQQLEYRLELVFESEA